MRKLSVVGCLLLSLATAEAATDSAITPDVLAEFQAIDALAAKSAYGEAEQKIQALLPRLQNDPVARATLLRNLAALYGLQKHYLHAAMTLEQAQALNALAESDAIQAWFELGQYYLAAENDAKATEALTHWIQRAPAPTTEHYWLLSELQLRLKAYAQAAQYLEKGIATASEPKAEWYQRLLAIHHENRDWPACVRVLSTLIDRFPENPLYWNQLTGVYQQANQPLHALAVRQIMYQRGWLKTPTEIVPLAQALRLRGMPVRAAELLQREIDQGRLEATAQHLSLLADAWTEARELEKAAATVEKLAAVTKAAESYHRLGQIYSELHRWAKARQAITQAVKQGKLKNPGGAYLLLGLAQYRLNAKDQARAAFVKAKETPAVRKTAQQWLDHLGREGR